MFWTDLIWCTVFKKKYSNSSPVWFIILSQYKQSHNSKFVTVSVQYTVYKQSYLKLFAVWFKLLSLYRESSLNLKGEP